MSPNDKPLIIYYVHHHGSGHVARFQTFAPALSQKFRIVAISSVESVVQQLDQLGIADVSTALLPSKWSDATSAHFVHTFRKAFEGIPYAPEPARRSQWLAELFLENQPAFFSDGSIELSIMARSMGVPTVSVRLHGHFEEDPTQIFAHEVSDILIAPYPAETEDEHHAYTDKTYYTGYFSKYAPGDREPHTDEAVSILLGYDNVSPEVITRSTGNQQRTFAIIGNKSPIPKRPNIRAHGRVKDIKEYITGQVVISATGTNSIAELLALGKKIVLLPEPRPYDEQLHTAEILASKGYAVLANEKMSGEEWDKVIDQATQLDATTFEHLVNPNAATELAQWLGEKYA